MTSTPRTADDPPGARVTLPPELGLEPIPGMARPALTACLACAALVVLLQVQHRLGVLHYRWMPFALLFATMLAGSLIVLLRIGRLLWDDEPIGRAVPWGLLAAGPVLLWAAVGWTGFHNWGIRHVPDAFLMNLARRAGASLMEGQLALGYPAPLRGPRVSQYHGPEIPNPPRDLAPMERYLADLEQRLDRRLRAPIHWVRGTLLGGMGRLSLEGLALAPPEVKPDAREPEPSAELSSLDRHETAHAFMAQMVTPDAYPPTILSEGWAEVCAAGWLDPQDPSGAWRSELASLLASLDAQQLTLADLFGPAWYYQDSGPVYDAGKQLVRHLVQRGGVPQFFELVERIRPDNAETTFRTLYGLGLTELENALRAEAGPPGQARPEPPRILP